MVDIRAVVLLPAAGNDPTGPAHLAWYASMWIYGTGVLTAITTALLVQKVSSGPVGLRDGNARLVP